MTVLAGQREWVGDLSLLRWGKPGEDRDALLLIHPANLQASSWQRVADSLSDRHPRLAVDLRGYGRSTRQGPFSITGWARDCGEIVDSLGLAHVHVVGASVGATVGFALAATRPERVASVLALGGAFLPVAPDGDEVLIRLQHTGLTRDLRRGLVAGAVGADTPEGVRESIVNDVSDNDAACAAALWRAALASDVRPLIEALKTGSAHYLVATGELDVSCPPDEARSVARTLGGSFRELAGVGHLPMYECPVQIAALIDEWVDGGVDADGARSTGTR